MATKDAFRRNSTAFALLTCLLAIPGAARAGDDAAARAAAASDPEYKSGYSSSQHGAALAGDCNEKPYAVREEFTQCQDQAMEHIRAARVSTPRPEFTAAARRSD